MNFYILNKIPHILKYKRNSYNFHDFICTIIHYIQNKRFSLNFDHSQCDCEMSLEKEHSNYRNKGVQQNSESIQV